MLRPTGDVPLRRASVFYSDADRVVQAHLRAGDTVALKDATQALADGAKAVISTTRANDPFGSAASLDGCREIRTVLAHFPDRLLIEDDDAGPIAGVGLHTLTDGRERWVTAKWLGPDLRVALVAGDRSTVA